MVILDVILAVLFGFLALEAIGIHGFDILLFLTGVAIGVFYGALIGRSMIKRIETQGVFRTTRRIAAYIIAAVMVFSAPLVFVLLSQNVAAGSIWLGNYGYTIIAIMYGTKMCFTLNWENVNQKEIVSEGFWGSRFRAIAKHPSQWRR